MHGVLPAPAPLLSPHLVLLGGGTLLSPSLHALVPSSHTSLGCCRSPPARSACLLTPLISFYTSSSEPQHRAPGSCGQGAGAAVAAEAPGTPRQQRGWGWDPLGTSGWGEGFGGGQPQTLPKTPVGPYGSIHAHMGSRRGLCTRGCSCGSTNTRAHKHTPTGTFIYPHTHIHTHNTPVGTPGAPLLTLGCCSPGITALTLRASAPLPPPQPPRRRWSRPRDEPCPQLCG